MALISFQNTSDQRMRDVPLEDGFEFGDFSSVGLVFKARIRFKIVLSTELSETELPALGLGFGVVIGSESGLRLGGRDG
jgi:hypothetical protein